MSAVSPEVIPEGTMQPPAATDEAAAVPARVCEQARVSRNFPQLPTAHDPGSRDTLPSIRRRAAAMLALGSTSTDVAKELGISRRTLWNWRNQDEQFRNELERIRRQIWEDAADQERSLLAPALDVLTQRLHDPKDNVRFSAAVAILRLSGLRERSSAARPVHRRPVDCGRVAEDRARPHASAVRQTTNAAT